MTRPRFLLALLMVLPACGRAHTGDMQAAPEQHAPFRLLARRILAAANTGDTVTMNDIVVDPSVVTRLLAWQRRDPRSLAAAATDSLTERQFSRQGPDTVFASFDFRHGSKWERVAIDFVRRGETWRGAFVGLRTRHRDLR